MLFYSPVQLRTAVVMVCFLEETFILKTYLLFVVMDETFFPLYELCAEINM
jgi:hypothetical protein